VGKVHGKEVGLLLHAGDDHDRFAKVRLCMPRRMCQRDEHLPEAATAFAHVILDDGSPALEAMLVAKTLEDALRGVLLLPVGCPVLLENAVDDIRERVQLRPLRRPATPVSRRNRVRQDLRYRLPINPKTTGRLSPAQTLMTTRKPNLQVKVH
jgi:hypothetical protein